MKRVFQKVWQVQHGKESFGEEQHLYLLTPTQLLRGNPLTPQNVFKDMIRINLLKQIGSI